MTDLKTVKDLRIVEELCEKLDTNVYLPVKEELKGIDRTYSFGSRKEDFKGLIDKKFGELRQEAIKCFKELEKLKKSSYFDKRDWFQNNFQENPVVVLRFLEWFFNITREDLKGGNEK